MRLSDYIFRRKNLKDLVSQSGAKNEDDLVFTIFNVEDLPDEVWQEYVGDDFEDFNFFLTLKNQHNLLPEFDKVDLDYLEDRI